MFPKGTKNLCLVDASVYDDFKLVMLDGNGYVDISAQYRYNHSHQLCIYWHLHSTDIPHIAYTKRSKSHRQPSHSPKKQYDQETKINPHKLKSHKIGLRFRMN